MSDVTTSYGRFSGLICSLDILMFEKGFTNCKKPTTVSQKACRNICANKHISCEILIENQFPFFLPSVEDIKNSY